MSDLRMLDFGEPLCCLLEQVQIFSVLSTPSKVFENVLKIGS